MIKAILAEEKYVVTVELTVRYHLPVPVGERVRFVGKVTGRKSRVTFAQGEATGSDGQVFATASAKYLEARADFKNLLLESIG